MNRLRGKALRLAIHDGNPFASHCIKSVVLDPLIANAGTDGQTRLWQWLAVLCKFQLNLGSVTIGKEGNGLFGIEARRIVMQREINLLRTDRHLDGLISGCGNRSGRFEVSAA